jgi:hypothetical protein
MYFPKTLKIQRMYNFFFTYTKRKKVRKLIFYEKITTINKSNPYNKNINWTSPMFIKSILKWMKLHNCSQFLYAHHSYCLFSLFGVSPHICGSSFSWRSSLLFLVFDILHLSCIERYEPTFFHYLFTFQYLWDKLIWILISLVVNHFLGSHPWWQIFWEFNYRLSYSIMQFRESNSS